MNIDYLISWSFSVFFNHSCFFHFKLFLEHMNTWNLFDHLCFRKFVPYLDVGHGHMGHQTQDGLIL